MKSMTYCTDYSVEDCIGLLSRKNIYDVFDYIFEMKTETMGEIIFVRCNKHFWHGLPSHYRIEFKRCKNTVINVGFIKEVTFFHFSTLFPEWITEFMEQKLNAIKSE